MSSRDRSYLPGLDGVRAVAIIGVLLFHLGLVRFEGGFLGVDVFFTLSGYLITGILLAELGRTGGVRFGNFYLRRARRLLPALFLVLLATALLTLVFARDAAHEVAVDARAALLYVTNWWYVFDARDYFEQVGRPPLLQHLWSLAVEEQFYLVWPLIAYGAYRWGGPRRIAWVAGIGAVASTVVMAVVANGASDTARAYYGTDTHASTLLVGAVLAVVWDPRRFTAALSGRSLQIVNVAGIAGLIGLMACFVWVSGESPWLYRGGFLVVGLLSAAVIAAAAVSSSAVAGALSTRPMRYLGTRSYGIYLWHWPIFMVTRPDLDLPLRGLPAMAVSLGLTLGAAELSYRYVEMPIRRGALGRLIARRRPFTFHDLAIGTAAAFTGVVLIASVANATVSIPRPSADQYTGGSTAVGAEPLAPAKAAAKADPASGAVTAIGDSVMLGARGALKERIRGLVVDAAIARQPKVIIARVGERKRANKLAPSVVLTVGANGYASRSEIAGVLRSLSDRRRVVLLTNSAPGKWVGKTNKNARDAAHGTKNVVVVDWHALSRGHRKYFYPDGIHLTKRGAAAYSAAIATGLR